MSIHVNAQSDELHAFLLETHPLFEAALSG